MKYTALKEYFIDNKNSLPKTLGNEFMFIADLKSYIENITELIEIQIVEKGENINKYMYPKALVGNLERVYKLLKDPKNHNLKGIRRKEYQS